MTQRTEFDCGTGQSRTVVLTVDEQTDYDVREAAGAAAAAQQATILTNLSTIQQRARAAIAANTTFLGLTPAQQATQGPAQIVRLTQECTALLRLVLNIFDSTAGT